VVALFLALAATADGTQGEIVAVGDDVVTVRTADGTLVRFELSPRVRIVSPSRYEIRPKDLAPGQHVEVLAREAKDADAYPRAQGIRVVHEVDPDDSR
jgi:hypothetical protein